MNNNKILTWKRGIFQRAFQLFNNGEQVGSLKPSLMTQSASGQINEVEYRFCTREARNRCDVIRKDNQEVVAQIKFGTWLPKATIEYKGEHYQWSLSNMWETRWKISSANGVTHRFAGWSCKGSIDHSLPTDLLAMTGLFISNYYWQMSAIYVAAFFPIWFAALS